MLGRIRSSNEPGLRLRAEGVSATVTVPRNEQSLGNYFFAVSGFACSRRCAIDRNCLKKFCSAVPMIANRATATAHLIKSSLSRGWPTIVTRSKFAWASTAHAIMAAATETKLGIDLDRLRACEHALVWLITTRSQASTRMRIRRWAYHSSFMKPAGCKHRAPCDSKSHIDTVRPDKPDPT